MLLKTNIANHNFYPVKIYELNERILNNTKSEESTE
jgi:hypothetical protein